MGGWEIGRGAGAGGPVVVPSKISVSPVTIVVQHNTIMTYYGPTSYA